MSKIFRKKALEQLSSPEQLDGLIQVIPRYAWISLVSFGVVIAAFLLWSYFGRITTSLGTTCIFYPQTENESKNNNSLKSLNVYSFVDDLTSKKIKNGMKVLIDLNEEKIQKYGYLLGTVASIEPSIQNHYDHQNQNIDAMMMHIIDNSKYKVTINPILENNMENHYKTSTGSIYNNIISAASLCYATIILKEQAPIDLVIPFFKKESSHKK